MKDGYRERIRILDNVHVYERRAYIPTDPPVHIALYDDNAFFVRLRSL